MALLNQLFDNAFFQLPMMEGMMYVATGLMIGAAILALWERIVSALSQPAEYREEGSRKELRRAA